METPPAREARNLHAARFRSDREGPLCRDCRNHAEQEHDAQAAARAREGFREPAAARRRSLFPFATDVLAPTPTASDCADSAYIALERIPAEIDAIGVSQIPEAG